MRTAILIHGWPGKEEYFDSAVPSPSNSHWFPWVQHQLLLNEIETQTPEMPKSYEPNYEAWKEMFERFVIDEETILIGHSCGGGFLVRWLSENTKHVGEVVLVAPWLDPAIEKEIDPLFFDFKIDESMIDKTKSLTVMYSIDDEKMILDSVEIFKAIS